MEDVLKGLFDFQRFSKNPSLAGMIADVESRYNHELSDEDLEEVNAAGELIFPENREDKPDE